MVSPGEKSAALTYWIRLLLASLNNTASCHCQLALIHYLAVLQMSGSIGQWVGNLHQIFATAIQGECLLHIIVSEALTSSGTIETSDRD